MAGTNSSFDSAAFRTAIQAAMTMGAPNDTSLQATFRWSEQKTYATADPNGNPYDWTESPATDTTHPDVQVPVAVKFSGQESETGTDAGPFSRSRAMITVLDTDYASVQGADQVLLGGKPYDIISIPMPEALFDVTVWTIYADARSAA